MAKSIEDIEGIGAAYGEKLRAAGCQSVDALLDAGRTPASRKALAEKTGISDAQVLKWVNMADLFRVKGIASQFAELLEGAGVDTVRELGQRNADNLAAKMAEVNAQKKLCKVTPNAQTVSDWIEQAKGLPRAVEY